MCSFFLSRWFPSSLFNLCSCSRKNKKQNESRARVARLPHVHVVSFVHFKNILKPIRFALYCFVFVWMDGRAGGIHKHSDCVCCVFVHAYASVCAFLYFCKFFRSLRHGHKFVLFSFSAAFPLYTLAFTRSAYTHIFRWVHIIILHTFYIYVVFIMDKHTTVQSHSALFLLFLSLSSSHSVCVSIPLRPFHPFHCVR